jgi:hypothetical protein
VSCLAAATTDDEENPQTPPPPTKNWNKRKRNQSPTTHKTPKTEQNRQKHEQPTIKQPDTSKNKYSEKPSLQFHSKPC